MTVLDIGSVGPEVLKWETFLRGRNYLLDKEVDETYTAETKEATRKWQEATKRLVGDGRVGPKTLQVAQDFGYQVTPPNVGPEKPTTVRPLTYGEKVAKFGLIAVVPAPVPSNPEAVRITNGWSKNNIKTVVIPQLSSISSGPPRCEVLFHREGEEKLKALFVAWEKAGLLKNVLTWGGSWVPRYVRGSRTVLSSHAWGTAFDINAAWNGLGEVPALYGSKGCVRDLVGLALENGFWWGGWGWPGSNPNRLDGMHFELF